MKSDPSFGVASIFQYLRSITVRRSAGGTAFDYQKNVIPADAVKAEFVGYVTGDVLAEGYNQCGARPKDEKTAMEAADLIGVAESMDIAAGTTQPVWVSVNVPYDAPAGLYKGTVTQRGAGVSLPYELKVLDRVLPAPSQWSFHLDLWQNPYAVARVAGVRPWSPEKFDADAIVALAKEGLIA